MVERSAHKRVSICIQFVTRGMAEELTVGIGDVQSRNWGSAWSPVRIDGLELSHDLGSRLAVECDVSGIIGPLHGTIGDGLRSAEDCEGRESDENVLDGGELHDWCFAKERVVGFGESGGFWKRVRCCRSGTMLVFYFLNNRATTCTIRGHMLWESTSPAIHCWLFQGTRAEDVLQSFIS